MIILLIVVVGGATVLGFWDLPPPTQSVEKVIPHERFLR